MSRIFLSSIFLFSRTRRSYWFFSWSSKAISYFLDNTWSLGFIHTAKSRSLWNPISFLRSKMTGSWCLCTPGRMFIPTPIPTKILEDYFINLKGSGPYYNPIQPAARTFRLVLIRQQCSNWIINPHGWPIYLNNRLLGLGSLVVEFAKFFFQLLWSYTFFVVSFSNSRPRVIVLTVQQDNFQSFSSVA